MSDELSQKYRHVFLTPIGREVLADILSMCHFGCTLVPENPAQIAEHNVGVAILANCGIFGPERQNAVMNALINSLESSKPKKEVK